MEVLFGILFIGYLSIAFLVAYACALISRNLYETLSSIAKKVDQYIKKRINKKRIEQERANNLLNYSAFYVKENNTTIIMNGFGNVFLNDRRYLISHTAHNLIII